MQADLYNGCKTVVVCCVISKKTEPEWRKFKQCDANFEAGHLSLYAIHQLAGNFEHTQ